MNQPDIKGSCASEFTKVRDAFERNFVLRNEVGAAVAVWVDGDLVVNLWGGSADAGGTRPGSTTRWPPCCPVPRH